MLNKSLYKKLVFVLVCLFATTGCSDNSKNYHNNYAIVNDNSYSVQDRNINTSDDGKSIVCEIGHLDGHFELASANLPNNHTANIHFEGNIESGRAKFVLVKPDKSIMILKEIISTENKTYSEDLAVSCGAGNNIIKFVGENYSGNFRMSKDDGNVFKYSNNPKFDNDF